MMDDVIDLLRAGQGEEAAKRLDAVLKDQDRPQPDLMNLRGVAALQMGRPDQAVTWFRSCLEAAPEHGKALVNLSNCLVSLGGRDEAERLLRTALERDPGNGAAAYNLGSLLLQADRPAEAEIPLRAAVALADWRMEALPNLATCLARQDRHEDAITLYREALAAQPDSPDLMASLADVLHTAGQAEEALAWADKALARQPGHAGARLNRANAMMSLDRPDEAVAEFRAVIAARPDWPVAHKDLGFLLLRLGRLAEGWDEAEWRNRGVGARPPLNLPEWTGAALAPGQRLLVWAEQGLGDEILGASCLPDLLAAGHAVSLVCHPRLAGLFRRSFPGLEVVDRRKPPPAGLAAQVSLSSLGRFFRRDFKDFPLRDRYLTADADQTAALRARYAQPDKRLVGLSWRSRNARFGDQKTLAPEALAPLLTLPGIRWVCLQYGAEESEVAALRQRFDADIVWDESVDSLGDMEGFAAQVAALDAVVSTSNTTVHFTGALGVPGHVLLPRGWGLLWYWLQDADRTPFYPGLTLHRQAAAGDWSAPIAAAAACLRG